MSKNKDSKRMSANAGDGPSSLNVKVQKKGVVYKLPFRKNMSGSWKKRLFVIKDGYLMYYKAPTGREKDGMTKFDIHPKGVLPLGRTLCEPVEPKTKPPPGYVAFMVSHPSFIKGNLIAACQSKRELDEWLAALTDASKVTFENAMEGDKKITELRSQGSKKLKEQKNLTKKAKEDAAEVKKLQTKRSEVDVSLVSMREEEATRAQAMEEVKRRQKEAKLEREKVENELEEVHKQKAELENQRAGLETKASVARLETNAVTKKLEEAQTKAQKNLEEAEEAARMLADEEDKLRAASKKRENDVAKAIKERDRLLAQIEQERNERLEMEKMLLSAEDSLKKLDATFRSKKMADLGIDVDIKNIRGMFDGSKVGSSNSRKNLDRKNSVDALKVGTGDARREAKREEARRKKREKRLAETLAIIGDSVVDRVMEEPVKEPVEGRGGAKGETEGETKGETTPVAPESQMKTQLPVLEGGQGRGRFDTDEIKAMEVEEEENDDDDDDDDDDGDEREDEDVVRRGVALFKAIDTDESGQIGKEEFLVALDSGNLEMTTEIKECVLLLLLLSCPFFSVILLYVFLPLSLSHTHTHTHTFTHIHAINSPTGNYFLQWIVIHHTTMVSLRTSSATTTTLTRTIFVMPLPVSVIRKTCQQSTLIWEKRNGIGKIVKVIRRDQLLWMI